MQLYRQVQGFNAPSAQLAQDGLVVDSGGDFEIVVSRERPEGVANWLFAAT